MSTYRLALQNDARASQPLRTGLAFAVTVAMFYALCTLVWLAAPGPFMNFLNSLFHGLDFAPLVKHTEFSWRGFLGAVAVLFVWALLAGTFFGWLRHRIGA